MRSRTSWAELKRKTMINFTHNIIAHDKCNNRKARARCRADFQRQFSIVEGFKSALNLRLKLDWSRSCRWELSSSGNINTNVFFIIYFFDDCRMTWIIGFVFQMPLPSPHSVVLLLFHGFINCYALCVCCMRVVCVFIVFFFWLIENRRKSLVHQSRLPSNMVKSGRAPDEEIENYHILVFLRVFS